MPRKLPDRKLRRAIVQAECARPVQGFSLQDDTPIIGSGYRLVTVQFRGKKVQLYHGCYTAILKRDAFKALIAANRRYRHRNKAKAGLRLVVSNDKRPLLSDTVSEAA